jgi:carboxymethylenebutenolidase
MCDQDHYEDDLKKYLRAGNVTRRDFGTLTAGVGLAMLLPRAADAQAVTETDVESRPRRHGRLLLVHSQQGAHAAVLIWPDFLGSARIPGRWANGSPSPVTPCSW